MKTLASIFILLSSVGTELPLNKAHSPNKVLRILEEVRLGNTPFVEDYFLARGFETIAKGQLAVNGGIAVDSLVMYNEESLEYLSIRTVDLDYLKNIELMMTLAGESESWQYTINELMQDNTLDLESGDIEQEALFVDNRKILIEDARWRKPTYSQFERTKKYQLTKLDGYIDFHIKEIVPQQYEIVLEDQLVTSSN